MRRTTYLTVALVAIGCNNPAYFDGAERLVIDAAAIDMAQAEGATNAHPLLGTYVQTEYWLDFRPPTAAQLAALRPAGAMPADMTPWVRRDALSVAVEWTLTNDSDGPLRAFVTLDGATEFFDYNPIAMFGAAGGEEEDEVQFPSLLGWYPRDLAAGEVLRGQFREDELVEAMYDLDVLSRFCGGPLAVLNNSSEANPIGTEGVPADAEFAGLVMLRLTLGASGPARLDYSVRLRETSERLYDSRRDVRRWDPMPEPFQLPTVAAVGGGGSGGAMDMCDDSGGAG